MSNVSSFAAVDRFEADPARSRTLPGRYGEPGGLLMIAWEGEKPAGTIALRRLSE